MIHGRVEQRLVLLDRRGSPRDEVVPLDLAFAEAGEQGGPAVVVGHRGEDPVGLTVGDDPQLALEEAHPEPEVHEVVGVEIGPERPGEPLASGGEVAADEGAPDDELDRLRRLVLVAPGRGVRALESPLRGLGGAEAVEDPRENALDPGARVGLLHAARLHELLEGLGQGGSRARGVAVVARHVAEGQEHLAPEGRVTRRVARSEGLAQVLERLLRLPVAPLEAGQREQDARGFLLGGRPLEESARLASAPLAQLDLAHRGPHACRARVHLAGESLLGGDREERLRCGERAPRGVRVARVLLAGQGLEGDGQRLAGHAGVRVRAHRFRQHARRGLGHTELRERDRERERNLRRPRIEAVALGRDPEGRRAEQIAILGEILVVTSWLAPGEGPQLVEQVDAAR